MQPVTSSALPDTSLFNLDGFGEELSTDSTELLVSPELSTTLLALDSLFPVVKFLPLTKDKRSGYYYIPGKIEPSDLESLYNYAGRIRKITLGAEPEPEFRMAPHVLARIARLQDPSKPLFPVLHHLRVVATSPSLDFLDLFLCSTLTTLELTGIPVDDPCYCSLLSFFECAVHQSPNLSTLILGPGVIQEQILNISLGFKNLHCLELRDVGISITDQLLRDIGSIQHLETFIFRDNGTPTYTRSPAIAASADSPVVVSALFPALQTLEVDGTFDLTEDLVAKVSSSDLRVLSIDITKSLEQLTPIPVKPFYFPEYLEDSEYFAKKKKKKGLLVTPRPSTPPQPPKPPQPPELSTTDIMMHLRCSIEKWPQTLVSVSFKNDSATSFTLPSDVFENILLRPDMKHLEITGMGIDSMEDSLCRVEEVEDPKLEVLHLPVHFGTTVSPARLRNIALASPHLKSLRCRLCIPDPSDMVVSPPLSHPLEVLSVSNGAPVKQHQLLGIARYLDSIFPKLKSIRAHGDNDTEQWRGVDDLVQSFQAVRMDEQLRLGLKLEK